MGKHKVWNKERRTPKHDDMCLWVDKNINKLAGSIIDKKYSEEKERKNREAIFLENILRRHTLPSDMEIDLLSHKKESEFLWVKPIMNKGYIVGIPDFKYSVFDTVVYTFRHASKPFRCLWLYIVYLEVKPVIKSLGDVMQQLKIYMEYSVPDQYRRYDLGLKVTIPGHKEPYHLCCKHVDFGLVTGSPEYKDVFERQGIHYFVVTDNMLHSQTVLEGIK